MRHPPATRIWLLNIVAAGMSLKHIEKLILADGQRLNVMKSGVPRQIRPIKLSALLKTTHQDFSNHRPGHLKLTALLHKNCWHSLNRYAVTIREEGDFAFLEEQSEEKFKTFIFAFSTNWQALLVQKYPFAGVLRCNI